MLLFTFDLCSEFELFSNVDCYTLIRDFQIVDLTNCRSIKFLGFSNLVLTNNRLIICYRRRF
ncbi:hypothetical protein DERF_002699 [Dermatophagoides farinae]|uniref:Uncharacterized protein n=1 Tax=Dermatophagoides farinae TaxID=6954 RepID=A0A922ICW7_DERFA|nr:hypothetical protein DERF_002699 [Dermatophagoides farinae]